MRYVASFFLTLIGIGLLAAQAYLEDYGGYQFGQMVALMAGLVLTTVGVTLVVSCVGADNRGKLLKVKRPKDAARPDQAPAEAFDQTHDA